MGLAARKSVLEELGYQVNTATNVPDALKCFIGGHFDLVVTDYRMPLMNGIELIKNVRKHDEIIPIILVSGFADALGLTKGNTGADFVIQKSANEVAHLVRAVNCLMRKKPRRKPPASAQSAPRLRRKCQ